MELFVSEPTQQGKKIRLIVEGSYTLDNPVKDVSVYPVLGDRTEIVIQSEKGRTYNVTLRKDEDK